MQSGRRATGEKRVKGVREVNARVRCVHGGEDGGGEDEVVVRRLQRRRAGEARAWTVEAEKRRTTRSNHALRMESDEERSVDEWADCQRL